MRGLSIHILDQLYLVYLLANAALALGFFAWFFVKIDTVVRENGSLDIYLNLIFRMLPWQIGLLFLYLGAEALIAATL